jgi:hypothetical protein
MIPISGHNNDVLHCNGGQWTVKETCGAPGCSFNHQGADYCNGPGLNGYRLPWGCNVTYPTTQGNNGDDCGANLHDHINGQAYAFDFGLPRRTPVLAARSGTVTLAAHVVGAGQACFDGCNPFSKSCCDACLNVSNHVNIQHVDGTVATYWHLDSVEVAVGQFMHQGDRIGLSGTSGCSTGPHLHFMVMDNCPQGYCQSVQISFDEAGRPGCGRDVTSHNCH